MIRVLFVCHGNICRSPMAEFIMKDIVKKAGLDELLEDMPGAKPVAAAAAEEVKAPPKKTVDAGIPGIDVIEIEDACKALWKEGIYAETGMGCTGPVIMVSEEDLAKARDVLHKADYI